LRKPVLEIYLFLSINCIIIIRNNNNNNSRIINNRYERLQEFILLFEIPRGTRKNFFEIYGQLRHGPSEKVRQPWTTVLRFIGHPRYTATNFGAISRFEPVNFKPNIYFP
jgi:hypothetical protein